MKVQFSGLGPVKTGEVEFRKFTLLVGGNNSEKSMIARTAYWALNWFNQDLRDLAGPPIAGEEHFRGTKKWGLSKLWSEAWSKAAVRVADSDMARARTVGSHPDANVAEALLNSWIGTWGAETRSAVRPVGGYFEGPTIWYGRPTEIAAAGFGRVFIIPANRAGQLEHIDDLLDESIMRFGEEGRGRATDAYRGIEELTMDFAGELMESSSSSTRYSNISMVASAILTEILNIEDIDWADREKLPGPSNPPQSTRRGCCARKPDIYVSDETLGRVRLSGANSSVQHLAPLYLILNNCALPGSTIVFEEPELGLDAKGQQQILAALIALVACGMRVVLTTNSQTILQELDWLLAQTRELSLNIATLAAISLNIPLAEAELGVADIAVFSTMRPGQVEDLMDRELGRISSSHQWLATWARPRYAMPMLTGQSEPSRGDAAASITKIGTAEVSASTTEATEEDGLDTFILS